MQTSWTMVSFDCSAQKDKTHCTAIIIILKFDIKRNYNSREMEKMGCLDLGYFREAEFGFRLTSANIMFLKKWRAGGNNVLDGRLFPLKNPNLQSEISGQLHLYNFKDCQILSKLQFTETPGHNGT